MSEQHPNFRRLIAGLDVRPALEELAGHPELWELLQLRQQYAGSAHVDTETIVLRGPTSAENLFDNLDCVYFESFHQLRASFALFRYVREFLKAREVGRVMIVRLKPDGWIRPHVDEGAYARYYARFHLVLDSNPACRFACGEEKATMAPGELWWFNHQKTHSVINNGAARTHLIMDFAAPGFTGALAHIRVPD
jgi:hypothetical protein